ncbi:MAG: hypothetical protein WB439_15455 [Acidobacteriaceae bacterium]
MIDIQPPEHTPHTWRDFFIHIATIVVGLIIAIGLEQSVEAIHHANERRTLVAEMRTEAERDLNTLHINIDSDLDEATWDSAVVTALQTARPQNGVVVVNLPAHQEFLPQIYPSRATWSVAKTNGKVALLPENQAAIYDRLDNEAVNERTAQDRVNAASVDLKADEADLGISLHQGATIKLPVGDIPALTKDIAKKIAALNEDALWNAFWAGAENAVAHGVRDREDMVSYLQQERAALPGRRSHGFPLSRRLQP